MDPTTEVEIQTPSLEIPKPKMAVKLPTKELISVVRASQSVIYLGRLEGKLVGADETKVAKAVKEITKRKRILARELVPGLKKAELKARLELQDSFGVVNRARNRIAKSDEPDLQTIRILEKHLSTLAENDQTVLKGKRRKEGTGKRVEQKLVYKDTPENRKRNRVGQEYTRVIWEDAEYEEVGRKIRRVKRSKVKRDGESKPRKNVWIEALQQAKQEAGVGKGSFVVVKKESSDPEDMGVKIYHRAREIMTEMRNKANGASSESQSQQMEVEA